jgi:chaperonin GroES
LPDTASKEKSEEGKVIAVGPGKKTEDGKVVPMVSKVFSLNSKRILSFSE